MRTAVKRGLSWLAAVAILISAMAVTSLFVLTDDSLSVWADTTSAQAADYNYKISAENAEVASGHVAAGTSASGYYALRGADGEAVANGSFVFKCKNAVEAYNFGTLISNVSGYNGTWSFSASKDGTNWIPLSPTTEKTANHPNPGWQAGYYNNYGTLKKSDGYLYLRATVSGVSQALSFPSIAYLEYSSDPSPEDIATFQGSRFVMTNGKDASQMGFAWQATPAQKNGAVKIAKKSEMKGSTFPATAKVFTGTAASTVDGYAVKVTVTGLQANTEYAYCYGDSVWNVWSPVYTFQTRQPDNGYKAILVGDPQIGAGSVATDGEGFNTTLNKAANLVPDAAFILSAGDQVDNSGSIEEYTALLNADQLKRLPFIPTYGNHDHWTADFKSHYNLPNLTGLGGTAGGSDYYLSYGNTLYIVLNGNNENTAEHRDAMEKAIASHPNALWRVVLMHQDVYGAGLHASEGDSAPYASGRLRKNLVPVFEELDIDIVLTGHDHSYARSHIMKNQIPQTNVETDSQGAFIAPDGILYITAGCSSMAKFYGLTGNPNWVAKSVDVRELQFSVLDISDNRFTIQTYRADTMELMDEVTLRRDYPVEDLQTLVATAKGLSKSDYTPETYAILQNAVAKAETVLKMDCPTATDVLPAIAQLETALAQLAPVDAAALLKKVIEEAEALKNSATVGSKPGNYPETAVATLNKAIVAAKSTANNPKATVKALEEAVLALRNAIHTFKKTVISAPATTNSTGSTTTSVSQTTGTSHSTASNGDTTILPDETTATDVSETTPTSASTDTEPSVGVAATTAPAEPLDKEPGAPWAWFLLLIPVALVPAAILAWHKMKNKTE